MDRVTYVADSGQELFSHTYGSILQCCIAIDGISFAYISRREKDNKYLCHVFQALTYEEVRVRGQGVWLKVSSDDRRSNPIGQLVVQCNTVVHDSAVSVIDNYHK